MSGKASSGKTALSGADFGEQLERQMRFLRRSCDIFDEGEYDEAIRIALVIRVLVHDTKNSKSLLSHLGIKSALSFIDTGVYRHLYDQALNDWLAREKIAGKAVSQSPSDVGLAELGDAGDGKVGWFAPLRLNRFLPETPPHMASRGSAIFDDWWNDPLVENAALASFSRSRLILIMANQDGGGHVDASLDAEYQSLKVDPFVWGEHGPSVQDRTTGGDLPAALHNVAFASVRQIAFELLLTLDRYTSLQGQTGNLALADPFSGIIMPEPPHKPMKPSTPIMVGQ